jgi:hypothetical protein
MSYVAASPETYVGQVVGDGQCVAFVKAASGAPNTAAWAQGVQVRGNNPASGTAIATFDPDGTYGNHTDGTSHAAIYVSQDGNGLLVWDQWTGQPVHQRTIAFRGGVGKPVNDGDAFYVIE